MRTLKVLIVATLLVVVASPAVAQDAGMADAGATPAENTAGDDGGSATPWAATQDVAVPLPSFLETTDRRIQDTRPPPTAEQVAALEEMEAEFRRFTRAGGTYRDTVVALVRREYQRQRRARDESYARQIREELRLQNEAMERAITLFERFIRDYPNDPAYTPDAMFRLGELYYERSANQFEAAFAAAEEERARRIAANQPTDDVTEPDKNFMPTIELYRRLIRQFPDYRRIDGVYYLIGYCLNEMAIVEEARQAWLNLVCAQRCDQSGSCQPGYVYRPEEHAVTADTVLPGDDGGVAEPDAGEDVVAAPMGPVAYVDPYMGCRGVSTNTQFFGEVWLRLGEYHFDYDNDPMGDRHGLDRAISAYSKLLDLPDDRNYSSALYKIAWSYYRASRFPEALEYFSKLIRWSDEERARTGRSGSELRPEAIQYMGITFAYADWNEDGLEDWRVGIPANLRIRDQASGNDRPVESPTELPAALRATVEDGFNRIRDTRFMPQDQAWTPEVYRGLGQVYFDEAHYPQAVEVWRYLLEHWPNNPDAPDIRRSVSLALRRNQQLQEQLRNEDDNALYCPGTPWEQANLNNPAALRRGAELCARSVLNTALRHHDAASAIRGRLPAVTNPTEFNSLVTEMRNEYSLAATGYRLFIQRYPNDPDAYNLQYYLAETLYFSDDFEGAAAEYARVRDSNLDDSHMSEAARRVVESLKKILERQVTNHEVEERAEPPPVEGTPPRIAPVQMPQILQRLAQARELYISRVDDRHDTERVRASYGFNNALLLYQYGYWPQARERFTAIYLERCSGPYADQTGQTSWLNLRNIAAQLQDTAEVERLGTDLLQRRCTFTPGPEAEQVAPGEDPCRGFCEQPENRDSPRCIACVDLTNAVFRHALETYGRAERATGEEQLRLYERAAAELVRAVNAQPNHQDAPVALAKAAESLTRAGRFESASRLYQRIIDDLGTRRADTPEEQQRLDAILGNAYFFLAESAKKFFDYDRAIQNYQVLVTGERFIRSTDPTMPERRETALINAAEILLFQQRYTEAADYYRRVVQQSRDPAVQRAAAYEIAEMAFKRQNWRDTVTEMQAFIARYRGDQSAGELVVQAYWRIAQARKNQNNQREYARALQEVVNAFAQYHPPAGSVAADYAAQAQFEISDQQLSSFETFHLDIGRPATVQAMGATIREQSAAGSTRAEAVVNAYRPIPQYGSFRWSVAAFSRMGRVYQTLYLGITNATFRLPTDLDRLIRQVPPDRQDEIRQQAEGTFQEQLRQFGRIPECLAIVSFATAVRASRRGNISTEYTQQALDALAGFDETRIAECVTEDANAGGPPQPGEFARSQRGQNLEVLPGVGAPGLARDE